VNSKWVAQCEEISGTSQRVLFTDDGRTLSYRDVVELWCEDEQFRENFTVQLSRFHFKRSFGRLHRSCSKRMNVRFECVLITRQHWSGRSRIRFRFKHTSCLTCRTSADVS
jgi:hypothetical protein